MTPTFLLDVSFSQQIVYAFYQSYSTAQLATKLLLSEVNAKATKDINPYVLIISKLVLTFILSEGR